MPGHFDVGYLLIQYVCLLFSLCVHEAAHAAMANRCGDPSARLLGRLSLNPLAHIDPIGTVVLPLTMMLTNVPFLFGWAKPVPFNPRNLHNIRRDPALIALAGPLSNLLVALIAAFALRIAIMTIGPETEREIMSSPLLQIPILLVMLNVGLMIFNLIPIPPLDGHHILYPFLPSSAQRVMEQMGPFGLLFVILFGGRFLKIIYPPVLDAIMSLAFLGTGI